MELEDLRHEDELKQEISRTHYEMEKEISRTHYEMEIQHIHEVDEEQIERLQREVEHAHRTGAITAHKWKQWKQQHRLKEDHLIVEKGRWLNALLRETAEKVELAEDDVHAAMVALERQANHRRVTMTAEMAEKQLKQARKLIKKKLNAQVAEKEARHLAKAQSKGKLPKKKKRKKKKQEQQGLRPSVAGVV